MDFKIDGGKSLEEQRKSLEFQEQKVPCKLTSLAKADPPPTNLASFDEVDLGEDIPDLVLVQISSSETIKSVTDDQKAAGKEFIFSGAVFVSGKEVTVAGFR